MTSSIIATDALNEARRVSAVCNACRFCEGFCATFPAMTKHRTFNDANLDYLANLCHNCNACFHSCQYATPHEFAINVPRAFAELRNDVYSRSAWPAPLARLLARNGLVVTLVTALCLGGLVGLLTSTQGTASITTIHTGPGAFYQVISHGLMVSVAGAAFGFSVLALAIGIRNYSRSIDLQPIKWKHLSRAMHDTASLRYLGGHDNDGCQTADTSFSNQRRIYHQLTLWGFVLCFASTSVATIYDYGFGLIAPYPVTSLPVLLGTIGGIALSIGCAGLFVIKQKSDPKPVAPSQMGMDYAFVVLLFTVSTTGLLLLALRDTSAMGFLLAIHLGFVLAFFLLMPYSKFVHAGYRFVALLKYAQESSEH
jgi:citrate/tricarballylate utilization protein